MRTRAKKKGRGRQTKECERGEKLFTVPPTEGKQKCHRPAGGRTFANREQFRHIKELNIKEKSDDST